MARTPSQKPRSQIVDLLLHTAELLGATTDKELAELCDVSVDNVAFWRSGQSQELKPVTLEAAKDALAARVRALHEQVQHKDAAFAAGLISIEIDEDAGPAAIQRKLQHRVGYDYLGHGFLYFEPQGALAWENLMKGGYDQGSWLGGVERCAQAFFDVDKDASGQAKGPIARALGVGKKGALKGLDVVSLGPGDGSKEAVLLSHVLGMQRAAQQHLPYTTMGLIDVSIPLLVKAAKASREVLRASPDATSKSAVVLPICADFEEGRLAFLDRLPSSRKSPPGVRLVLMLGNVFGNVRDEEVVLKERLAAMMRPGDLLWLEVAVRLTRVEDDPLFKMTQASEQEFTAPEASRRLLLEGPFRRWEAAMGRRPTEIVTRVWLRDDDDTCPVPGSQNFCHDLVMKEERRACTMLYSRRYDTAQLARWLERHGFDVVANTPVEDSQKRARVAHLLAKKR